MDEKNHTFIHDTINLDEIRGLIDNEEQPDILAAEAMPEKKPFISHVKEDVTAMEAVAFLPRGPTMAVSTYCTMETSICSSMVGHARRHMIRGADVLSSRMLTARLARIEMIPFRAGVPTPKYQYYITLRNSGK